jgi:hypothetical protein
MRLQAILPTLLFATASVLSYGAYSATDADKAQPADVKTDQPATKIAKPQCHMDESSGMTQQMPAGVTSEQKCVKLTAAQDRSKHYHPRDGK